jgi:hypothetical protein
MKSGPWIGIGGYGAMLGLELDEVLEGPDVVPIVEPADRIGQIVRLPALVGAERTKAEALGRKFFDDYQRELREKGASPARLAREEGCR